MFVFPDEQRSTVNESSSLLGGSPHRHCRRKSSPYHTGQLHPAVRVADLLQHINQMKTAEGYGFKQEYEVRDPLSFGLGPGHASKSRGFRSENIWVTFSDPVGVLIQNHSSAKRTAAFFTCGLWRATPTRLF